KDEGGSSTSVATTATIGGFLAGLFREGLGGLPHAPGLRSWGRQLHAGPPPALVARALWGSSGDRGPRVDQFYEMLLHRKADLLGREFWVTTLLAGVSENDVSVAFLTSPEYTASHVDVASYVTGLYMDVLNRQADTAGMSFWKQVIQNGA